MSSTIEVAPGERSWKLARRRRIVDATLDLLRTRPPQAVSMDDVAHAAGTGKATLYRYFETKEALVLSCLEVALSELRLRLEAAAAGPGAAPEVLRAIVAVMVDTFSRDLLPLRVLARRDGELHAEWRRSVQDARHRLVAVLAAHLEAGAARRWYRPVDSELVAHMTMGMIRSAVTHVEGRSRDQLVDGIADVLLAACRAR